MFGIPSSMATGWAWAKRNRSGPDNEKKQTVSSKINSADVRKVDEHTFKYELPMTATSSFLGRQGRLDRKNASRTEEEQIRNSFVGNKGRVLKCNKYPDLCLVIEYVSGEGDRIERGGGCLELHPKLLKFTLYLAPNNQTKMKSARDTILALAPEGLKISLSACYNYTINYKAGTAQAAQHQDWKGNQRKCISS